MGAKSADRNNLAAWRSRTVRAGSGGRCSPRRPKRGAAMTGVAVRVGSGIVLAAAAGLAVLTWVSSNRAIHPGTETYTWSLRDYPELRPHEVNLPSSTGVNIAGRFFPGRQPETVILSHGYGGSQDEMLPVAASLHAAGLSVFTYDLRGSGRSQGEVTFGSLEQKDLISVVDYLQRRPDVDQDRIGALGFSMGAAVTLLAAAEDTRIKAVVSDSAWSDVNHWLRPSLGQILTHPIAPFSTLSLKLAEWRTGADLSALRPVQRVARLTQRPLLLIHGSSDAVVPASDSDELFAAAGEPKELWQKDGAGHGDTMRLPEYGERVTRFFRQALQRPANTSTGSGGNEGCNASPEPPSSVKPLAHELAHSLTPPPGQRNASRTAGETCHWIYWCARPGSISAAHRSI